MREFEPILNHADKTTIVNQRQVDYEKKFLGSIVRHNGHTMYEINCTTGEITEAEYENERVEIVPTYDINFGTKTGTSSRIVRDVVTKENCLYISSLNKKSAKKKYLKWVIDKQILIHKSKNKN